MKKLLVIITVATLSTPAFAETVDKVYLRADVGGTLDINRKVTILPRRGGGEVTIKSKISPTADLGIGYNVSEEFRAELVFLHRFNPKMNGSANITGRDSTLYTKSKAKIETLMLRGYFNLYDFGIGKLFAGAGLGVAQVSQKGTWSLAGSGVASRSGSFKAKKKRNLAYSLAAGVGFKLQESVSLDLQYNWSDFGGVKGSSIKYRGHSALAGLRVDLF